jgi:hypothetical protein
MDVNNHWRLKLEENKGIFLEPTDTYLRHSEYNLLEAVIRKYSGFEREELPLMVPKPKRW